jgi:hypothetical protein
MSLKLFFHKGGSLYVKDQHGLAHRFDVLETDLEFAVNHDRTDHFIRLGSFFHRDLELKDGEWGRYKHCLDEKFYVHESEEHNYLEVQMKRLNKDYEPPPKLKRPP